MKAMSRRVNTLSVFTLCLAALLPARVSHAQLLLSDDFSGASLSPLWAVQRGYASLVNGWVRTQGSTPGSRDAFIMAGEGSDWSNYQFSTKFHADGGGNNWYNSLINFRVQSQFGWSQGTFYSLYIFPPNSAIPPADSIQLVKFTSTSASLIDPTYYASGLMTAGDNAIDISAIGGSFTIKVNGVPAASFLDADPIPTGGVALGSIWESATRYDYAYVAPIYTINALYDLTKVHKGGSTVPITLQLLGGNGVNASSPSIAVTAISVTNVGTGATVAATAPGNSNPNNTFRYDSGEYLYNLKTKGYAAGTYNLNFIAGSDPTLHSTPFLIR
ncbi:PxKF domain-containing protein [Armatimonas sp.]|uniref:PxKF domain-containing protein n=1 Tax=Armatimonas sp. TaxID=1872638 RepID=UPI00286BDD42|nr:PxKF domain-containing protein [Armatimonas sp.]